MKRRSFLTQATGSAALLGSTPLVEAQTPALIPDLVLTPPVVMAPRPDGAELVWGVSRHARGIVEVKTGEVIRRFGGNAFGFSSQGKKVLRVSLDGLTPGQTHA